ncbi:replication protein A 70 kDa DNA-binding subunit B [Tanacetum coccineum]
MGYQKSPNFGSSSVGSSSFGSKKSKGVEMPSNVTMIKDIEPTLDNITVQGRVVSLWHSHRVNEAHNPYSLDFVFQDLQNSRIQVYIKKDFMFTFEPLFEEGKCYSIANFAIAENSVIQDFSGPFYVLRCASEVLLERVVWVDIEGYPTSCLVREKRLPKMGNKWGEALDIEDNFGSSFARKRLCILTKQPESILEKFKVIFKDGPTNGEDMVNMPRVDAKVYGHSQEVIIRMGVEDMEALLAHKEYESLLGNSNFDFVASDFIRISGGILVFGRLLSSEAWATILIIFIGVYGNGLPRNVRFFWWRILRSSTAPPTRLQKGSLRCFYLILYGDGTAKLLYWVTLITFGTLNEDLVRLSMLLVMGVFDRLLYFWSCGGQVEGYSFTVIPSLQNDVN